MNKERDKDIKYRIDMFVSNDDEVDDEVDDKIDDEANDDKIDDEANDDKIDDDKIRAAKRSFFIIRYSLKEYEECIPYLNCYDFRLIQNIITNLHYFVDNEHSFYELKTKKDLYDKSLYYLSMFVSEYVFCFDKQNIYKSLKKKFQFHIFMHGSTKPNNHHAIHKIDC